MTVYANNHLYQFWYFYHKVNDRHVFFSPIDCTTTTGSLHSKTGGGRKKVNNEEQATAIIAAHEANPFKTAVETAKEQQVSRWTVGRVL